MDVSGLPNHSALAMIAHQCQEVPHRSEFYPPARHKPLAAMNQHPGVPGVEFALGNSNTGRAP